MLHSFVIPNMLHTIGYYKQWIKLLQETYFIDSWCKRDSKGKRRTFPSWIWSNALINGCDPLWRSHQESETDCVRPWGTFPVWGQAFTSLRTKQAWCLSPGHLFFSSRILINKWFKTPHYVKLVHYCSIKWDLAEALPPMCDVKFFW